MNQDQIPKGSADESRPAWVIPKSRLSRIEDPRAVPVRPSSLKPTISPKVRWCTQPLRGWLRAELGAAKRRVTSYTALATCVDLDARTPIHPTTTGSGYLATYSGRSHVDLVARGVNHPPGRAGNDLILRARMCGLRCHEPVIRGVFSTTWRIQAPAFPKRRTLP